MRSQPFSVVGQRDWDWGIILKQVQDGLKAADTVVSTVVPIVAMLPEIFLGTSLTL
jgi:hypothetical protein